MLSAPDHGDAAERDSCIKRFEYTPRMSEPADPEQLFAGIYEELKRLAHRQLAGRKPRTLCTTALVHEAYIKLMRGGAAVQDRQHFVSLVVRAMRQILADAARRRLAEKRGGDAPLVTLDTGHPDGGAAAVDVLALEKAIDRLRKMHDRLASVVEMHFYGGLSFVEIADLLGLAERTVHRDWTAARALLERELETAA